MTARENWNVNQGYPWHSNCPFKNNIHFLTDVFHAILTTDLRTSDLRTHIIPTHCSSFWSVSMSKENDTLPSCLVVSHQLSVLTLQGTWTEASSFCSGWCLWQRLSSRSVALLAWGPLPQSPGLPTRAYCTLLQRQSLKSAGSAGKVLRAVERG